MAAIGRIRKHGVFLLIIIGIALLAFLLGDLSRVKTVFSKENTMAKVDGTRMDKIYREQYEQNIALMKFLQNKSSFDEDETYRIHQMTWQQLLQDVAINKQLEPLGLVYSEQMIEDFKAELIAGLRGQNPNQFMAQFANALAQIYGLENALTILSNIEEYKGNEQVMELYRAYEAVVRFALSIEKTDHYMALVQNTLYFSDPLAKKMAEDNNTAMVSMMTVNPQSTAFKDIAVDVPSRELKEFYNIHKEDLYNIRECNRDIDVAVFPIVPTQEDLTALEDSVRNDFQYFTSVSMLEYATRKGNGDIDSTYYKSDDIMLDILDSLIFKSPVGSFISPFNYQDEAWYFGKVYGAAARPDSILVASIQLPFKTRDNTTASLTRKQAKAEADSLKTVITSREATIFDLQKKYLEGRQQGDTTFWLPERGTITGLYNSLLETPNGGVYIYNAPNGYLLLQVISKTTPVEKRQFVLFNYDILASETTLNAIKSNAVRFASSVNSAENLVTEAAKQGIQMVKGTNVGQMASTIGQITGCRDIVSWAYTDKIGKDAVSDAMNINRNLYAVAAIREIRNAGIAKFKDVKDDIKNRLETEKKIESVTAQISGTLATANMQTLAQQYSTQISDSIYLHFNGNIYQNHNVDNTAIGKIFNLPEHETTAIPGKDMVYIVNVHQINKGTQTPDLSLEKNILRNQVLGNQRNEMSLVTYLINNMQVYDNRGRFYQ